ncbi:MAG: peptidylprolyl isomerase [Bdellovibrionaceae bacterium]|nr:peptidylprolyl isomerase [Pseudobdellovibrionaceae bacterium]
MRIDSKKVITMAYSLSVIHPDGVLELIDKRDQNNPIEFVFGHGAILPSVEKEIKGKEKGFCAEIKVPPQEAFGVRNEKLVLTYPLSKLPKGINIQVGMKFQTQGPDGEPMGVIVREVKEGEVVLDGNHPLADAYLQFEVTVLKVREATETELKSGQVHGPRLH